MLTIHHLGVSQSDRVVWLCEELGVPYHLRWYDRGPDGLAPPDYRALHPAATAPVIEDEGRVLTESAAILEYVSHRYGDGRLSVASDDPNYPEYVYWMHFNNNVQGLFFARLASRGAAGEGPSPAEAFIRGREDRYYAYLDQRLGESPWLAGPDFTCADIMVTFNLTSLSAAGGRTIEDLPNVQAYVGRIAKRPAYVKAMEIAGPGAKRPEA